MRNIILRSLVLMMLLITLFLTSICYASNPIRQQPQNYKPYYKYDNGNILYISRGHGRIPSQGYYNHMFVTVTMYPNGDYLTAVTVMDINARFWVAAMQEYTKDDVLLNEYTTERQPILAGTVYSSIYNDILNGKLPEYYN